MSAFMARADSSCLDLVEIKYHQLKHIANPSAALRAAYGADDDYFPEGYETYQEPHDDTKQYAVNPIRYQVLYHYQVTLGTTSLVLLS